MQHHKLGHRHLFVSLCHRSVGAIEATSRVSQYLPPVPPTFTDTP